MIDVNSLTDYYDYSKTYLFFDKKLETHALQASMEIFGYLQMSFP